MTAPRGANSEIACAKINLALHVRKRRDDGYHELETLFAFAEDGDLLEVAPSTALTLSISGPFGAGLSGDGDNLVLRAAETLRERAGISEGAGLHLTKTLPIAAGIGGGSADAAAAIRLLVRHWNCAIGEAALLDLAAGLGADVPACLRSNTCVGRGVGDVLEPFDSSDVSGLPVLLVNPDVPCPTGPVFKAWDCVDRGPLDPVAWRDGRNDLEAPACFLVPEISRVLETLADQDGVTTIRMSGSGATCFAIFNSAQQCKVAAASLAERHPGWWVLASRLRA